MTKKPEIWMPQRSEPVADCRVFTVREDFCENQTTGKKASFFVIENPDWANVIALTSDRQVVLIEQYRQGSQEITLEIPGGMVDEGEDPLTCAKRELLEETGYTTRKIVSLGFSHPNPALQENKMYHYLALDCEPTGLVEHDEHESIVTKTVSLDQISRLITDGAISHSLVIACFYRFEQFRLDDNIYLYES